MKKKMHIYTHHRPCGGYPENNENRNIGNENCTSPMKLVRVQLTHTQRCIVWRFFYRAYNKKRKVLPASPSPLRCASTTIASSISPTACPAAECATVCYRHDDACMPLALLDDIQCGARLETFFFFFHCLIRVSLLFVIFDQRFSARTHHFSIRHRSFSICNSN